MTETNLVDAAGAVIPAAKLEEFVKKVFRVVGVSEKDAQITARVLVQADWRGIESHGVARLSRYITGIQNGLINPKTKLKLVKETKATAFFDAANGLGQVAGHQAMNYCIKKAKKSGAAWVAVRNSNHYGIAGYYSMLALKHNMIGISMTNSRPLCVPTYSREAIIGTNPISVAAPADREQPFVLDMATSVVPIGKIEVAKRKGASIPLGWAVDKTGQPTTDPAAVLEGGGVLPLGGTAEFSGYKGYGLSVMIDILCGVLTGASFLSLVEKPVDGKPAPANLGHFFGAINIKSFRPLKEFKKTMDLFINILKNSAKAEGCNRIFIAGEKEFEMEESRRKNGIPLDEKTVSSLKDIRNKLGIKFLEF
ncbi:MAG: Ldh family oxidoreductase [Planctomycetota bacterium]